MSEEHWDRVYATKGRDDVSWYQAVPATSICLVTAAMPATAAPRRVIDIGAGASTLADELFARGYEVTVLDVAPSAVASVKARLGDRARPISSRSSANGRPETSLTYGYDRCPSFTSSRSERAETAYVNLAARAVRAGWRRPMGTLPDGPVACSGLPTSRYDALLACCPVAARLSSRVSSECDGNTEPAGAPSSRSPGDAVPPPR